MSSFVVMVINGEGVNCQRLFRSWKKAKAYEEKYGLSNSYQLAEIYGYVGDIENTFKWLEMSHEVHDPGMPWLQVSLFLDSARGDPRWPAMVKLAGL